jgi:hypothetical protein
VRGNEVGNEIKAKTPPNGAKDITCDFLHSSHQGNAVVDFGEDLEQENQNTACKIKKCNSVISKLIKDYLDHHETC